MNIWRYLKDTALILVAFLVLFLTVNFLLVVSSTLEQSLPDILYLDLLILILAAIFFIAGYFSWRNRYIDLYHAVHKREDVLYNLPTGDRLEVELMLGLVRQITENADETFAQSERRFESLNDYITRWVHEIKIPLSVCELLMERLEDGAEADHQISQELNLEIARIKFLVNQVLYASRSYASAEDLQVDDVNLDNAVREAVRRNSVFFYTKNIEVMIKEVADSVLTDKKGLAYILDQILHNASKYSGKGGKVIIHSIEEDKAVILTIRDHGMGIPKKDIDRIFDMGFTGENGRKTAKSTGMGLYFSKLMADRLGHRITVNSQVGQYTEFKIEFFKFSDYYSVTKM